MRIGPIQPRALLDTQSFGPTDILRSGKVSFVVIPINKTAGKTPHSRDWMWGGNRTSLHSGDKWESLSLGDLAGQSPKDMFQV